ncbi:G-type lectin S-receptor-like serine/threonine-protein kinase RKS1 [Miscanthus floridulus]|uniref:G-type lectin S-receptor-like serine/threonine-protein kinase RKS1 n=1 Tax=Miscanthus floridulus TaxID=154761 RepID=UPI0034591E1B
MKTAESTLEEAISDTHAQPAAGNIPPHPDFVCKDKDTSHVAVLNLLALIFATLLLLLRRSSGAGAGISLDTLNSGGNITDGETLLSAGGSFTLGFFSPSTTVPTKRYLGIWFTASGTDAVLWVANRDTPLNTTSGVLVMSNRVGLRLLDGSGQTAWSSNTTGASASSVAQLLESGNLVVREQSSSSSRSAAFQWQSFDHPSNTLLAGMRFGKNLKTGLEWSLTSWRAKDDPATGDYRRVMDTRGLPDIVTWQGSAKYRAGPWNGRWFSGVPEMDSQYKLFYIQMVDGPDEVTYVLNTTAGTPFTRIVLDEVGKVQVLLWIPSSRVWKEFPWLPRDACDDYASCATGKRGRVAKILVPVMASVLVLTAAGLYLVWICKLRAKRRNKDNLRKAILGYSTAPYELGDENVELPFVSFGDIAAATNNFSEENMLGQGGFGKVYKGMLGQNIEVAVKRLGQSLGQGVEKFRNEVVLIAKLQHRNLVRLLGCCIDEDEKLLIYEYLPNRSLDSIIFDAAGKYLLDWPTRCKIIKGVSRGLLYLHQDSRLTIIHRDLKTSNLLLDADMSPKISDFGMARIFGGNQHEANTNRVVGTYGYMSPEYAMDGAFSVKSDTYSFGVIVLEIISSLKISLTHCKGFSSLLAYAWSLWIDDRATDLVDSSLAKSCSYSEALRCIQIGLLCVQDNPNSRPLMLSVVTMLENETTPLPVPIQPMYFSYRGTTQGTEENTSSSMNNMSLATVLEGR